MLNQHHTETIKLSFVLFDEIEKASDALWNLLLGILDKGVLTLGDNRKVDFSRAMIFMTSNLGASEMSAIMSPKLGFNVGHVNADTMAGVTDEKMTGKLARSGMEAAKRKFTPEFMNRLDKIVTFQPLGTEQLKRILEIELNLVQQRIFNAPAETGFRLHAVRRQQGLLADGRHRHEVWRPAPQARHRAAAGSADVEPDRYRPGAGRRLDSGGFRRRPKDPELRPRSRRAAGCRHGSLSRHVGHDTATDVLAGCGRRTGSHAERTQFETQLSSLLNLNALDLRSRAFFF